MKKALGKGAFFFVALLYCCDTSILGRTLKNTKSLRITFHLPVKMLLTGTSLYFQVQHRGGYSNGEKTTIFRHEYYFMMNHSK